MYTNVKLPIKEPYGPVDYCKRFLPIVKNLYTDNGNYVKLYSPLSL